MKSSDPTVAPASSRAGPLPAFRAGSRDATVLEASRAIVALFLRARSTEFTIKELADHAGLPLSLVTDFSYPGHSQYRCHTVPGRSGATMLDGIVRAVRRTPPIDLMVPARIVDASREAGRHAVPPRPRARRVAVARRGAASRRAARVGPYGVFRKPL